MKKHWKNANFPVRLMMLVRMFGGFMGFALKFGRIELRNHIDLYLE